MGNTLIILLYMFFLNKRSNEQFCSYKGIEKWLDSWIASRDELVYRNDIRTLPERWAKVVAKDGQYFE